MAVDSSRRSLRSLDEPSTTTVGVLAMGDFGDERCGVGSSLGALARTMGHVVVLDANAPLRTFLRGARVAAASGAPCAAVYPTRTTVYNADLPLRLLVLRVLFGRRRLRLHLHEFERLRRKLRYPATLALLLPGRIVVSSESEATAVRAALHGWIGRHREVVVCPPTNGTAPAADAVAAALVPGPDRTRTVGVFGMRRADKGVDWLVDVLTRLDRRFDRLVLAGDGWDEQWPAAVRDRYEIEVRGHVDGDDLPELFGGWGVAVAPLWAPAHDGRMSLRTPLAYGVPTLTVGPAPDLTLAPDHLLVVPPTDPGRIPVDIDRRAGAQQVANFERAVAARLVAALFGPADERAT